MIQSPKTVATDLKSTENWAIGATPKILNHIHNENVNIAIYERDTNALRREVNNLLKQNIEFRASGDIEAILSEAIKIIDPGKFSLMIRDIKEALTYFKAVTGSQKFRLLLATVNTNMCRRFHTDINDVRMLCTYSGPGTLWLTDDNINSEALSDGGNESIVKDESKVQQAKTGAVVLLKGAIYPQEPAKAVVHRSPTIEETGEKRLLLRIDSTGTLNFWS